MGLRRKITNSIPFSVLNLFFFSLVYGKDVHFSEKSQLLKLKNTISDPHNMLSTWKSTNHNHCSWFGVTCNSHSRVSELKIPGNYHSALQSNRSSAKNRKFLGGKLSNAIGGFLELRVLSIPFNRMIGEFPDEIWGLNKLEVIDIEGNSIKSNLSMINFANLKNLHVLNLGFNRLFGEIPNSLANCNGLIRLNLAGNQIQGPIPSFIGCLTKLNTINFSFNRFSGSLPNKFWTDCHVLEHIDFSNNFLTGKPPKSVENCTNLRTLLLFSNNFTNNIGPIQQRRSLSDSSSTNPKKKGFSWYELILIIVATFIVVILAILIIACLYITHRKKKSRVEGIPSPARSGTERLVIFKEIGAPLTFAGVIEATGNFTSRNCIGSGGFGSTYRAEISPGTIVAVKRLTIEMCQGVPQFKAEIRTLGRIRHPNLITLIGYYASTSEMFLIYNYLSGGSLEDFIRDKKTRVTELKTVHKIALNVASALWFLHGDCNPRIIHRDVKPSNILLDDDFNAFLSDFGLSRLLEGFETHVTTGVAGTFGYVAPEYALACRASDRADVYSYGVMLLELISDKRALDVSFSSQENGYTIVSWAVMLQRAGRAEEVFSGGLWEVGPQEVLMEMLELGLSCTAESPAGRPAMRQVVRKLREIQSVFDR